MTIGTPVLGTPDEQTAASITSTPSYPSGIAAGDLLLLMGASGSPSAATFTTPSGWTNVAQLSGTGNTIAPSVYMARKFASGSETGTLSVSHGSVVSSMGIMKISGVDSTTPFDVSAVQIDDTTANSTFTIPSQTLVTNGVACVYVLSLPSSTATVTPPFGFTEDVDHTVASTRSWEIAHKTGFSSGITGAITASLSGSAKKVAIAVFLRPASPPVTSNIYYKNASGTYVAGTLMLPNGLGGYV